MPSLDVHDYKSSDGREIVIFTDEEDFELGVSQRWIAAYSDEMRPRDP